MDILDTQVLTLQVILKFILLNKKVTMMNIILTVH